MERVYTVFIKDNGGKWGIHNVEVWTRVCYRAVASSVVRRLKSEGVSAFILRVR